MVGKFTTPVQCPGKGRLTGRRQDASYILRLLFLSDRGYEWAWPVRLHSACFEQTEKRRAGEPPRGKVHPLAGATHFCPLLLTAMAFVSYGFELVRVRVEAGRSSLEEIAGAMPPVRVGEVSL